MEKSRNPQPSFWAVGVMSTFITEQYRWTHLNLLQSDWAGAQGCDIKHSVLGALEEGFLIGYDYLYLCFRNDAVARGGFEFLTLKDPRREISAEMCSRSYIPEPLLSLVEELLMLTHALTLCIQPASSVRRSSCWTPFNKILLLFIPPSLRLSDS